MTDKLTPKQRSYCMSRVRSKDTDIEMKVRSELHLRGFRYTLHPKDLPGKPDVVFKKAKLAVFIDGDFWHGYRLPTWEHKLTEFWKEKINKNRKRDQKNFRKLRRMEWKVIRLWQHDIEQDLDKCIQKIIIVLDAQI